MAAAAFNKIELVKLLLDNGVDIAASDDEDMTALQVAENKGNNEIVTLLRTAKNKTANKK